MPQSFPQRRPLLFVGMLLLICLGVRPITFIIRAIWLWPALAVSLIGECLLGLAAVFLLSRFRWWRVSGFRAPRYSPALLCLLAPCFVLINDANTVLAGWDIVPGRGNALLFFILAMLVGFIEEAYFRGMMLRALLVKGPWLAAIISSVLFGGLHLLHLIEGQNLAATLVQVASAMALGFLFAAVALHTQSILPLIVIHGLTDFVAFLVLNGTRITYAPSSGAVTDTAVEALIYIALGVIALRRMRPPELNPDLSDGRGKALIESGI